MRTVEIAPGVVSSVLGFGCAPILGSVGGKAASRAIDCAIDCGITHFDLARSYGYGEAEAFVGKCIKSRRDQVVLASKFGIQANWKAALLRPLKQVVRKLRSVQGAVPRPATVSGPSLSDRFHHRIPLDEISMRRSLECTLRALRSDYVDVFFVHEPLDRLDRFEQLLQTGRCLKEEGKIKALGLATPWSTSEIHQSYLESFDLIQFDNSTGSLHYEKVLATRRLERNIFFSPLRGSTTTPEDTLRKMWRDFPNSLILCSMFKEEHIKMNSNWASAPV